MTQDRLVGIAHIPGGVEMHLLSHGDAFTIVLEDTELMSTEASASERALARLACAALVRRGGVHRERDAALLIGGYGMGFTLRAALERLGPGGSVVVAEIAPEILDWARGPMAAFTGQCLTDPRVTIVEEDVALLIGAAREGYDAILLDVDNGPEGLTRRGNDHLYSPAGLERARRALRPGGVLAIWSASHEDAFVTALATAGFTVEEHVESSAEHSDAHDHVIWLAHRAD